MLAHAMANPAPGCVFCSIAGGALPAEIVVDEPDVLAFLDARPLFPGHTLVVPRRHVDTLVDLPDDLLEPVFATARRVAGALPAALGAQGTFVAINNVVSQSVPHLHVHVVPRTKGDGLKGFFWPRHTYESAAEMTAVADRIRAAL
ncbi:MAG TPA: HIT family protein [Acidimicrobiales bacterium]|nr:HIT family protein [Acidimicrobiales bacterium]